MKSISSRKLRRKPPHPTRDQHQKLAARRLRDGIVDRVHRLARTSVSCREKFCCTGSRNFRSCRGIRKSKRGDTPPYLAAPYEFPLLTRDQEYQIFRKMHFLRSEAAALRERLTLTTLNSKRVQRIQGLLQEAEGVRNRIVQCNLRLVVSIAKMMVDLANSLDDLISEGNFPLIRAARMVRLHPRAAFQHICHLGRPQRLVSDFQPEPSIATAVPSGRTRMDGAGSDHQNAIGRGSILAGDGSIAASGQSTRRPQSNDPAGSFRAG